MCCAEAATAQRSPMTCLKHRKRTEHTFRVTLPVGKIHHIEAIYPHLSTVLALPKI